jgi:hypothetical protein
MSLMRSVASRKLLHPQVAASLQRVWSRQLVSGTNRYSSQDKLAALGGAMAPCSRLPEVAATHTNVLNLVLSHLPPGGAGRMRNVSRLMRTSVNRCVSTVACAMSAPRFSCELADTFPQADRLRVELDLDSTALAAAQDTAMFFDYILAMSPVLATKLRTLRIFMNSASTFDSIRAAVTSFVSRCALH